jgi:hypothetical protein
MKWFRGPKLKDFRKFIYHAMEDSEFDSLWREFKDTHNIKEDNQWINMMYDRGGVPDLSVSGDKSDLVVVDPHDPTTTSETRSANAIAEPTPDGYRPCWCKISLITKINSCAQSKNEQESEASNLNITRRWSLNYTTAAR